MAADVVLFGTLRDPELLDIVLGCVAQMQPVTLDPTATPANRCRWPVRHATSTDPRLRRWRRMGLGI